MDVFAGEGPLFCLSQCILEKYVYTYNDVHAHTCPCVHTQVTKERVRKVRKAFGRSNT